MLIAAVHRQVLEEAKGRRFVPHCVGLYAVVIGTGLIGLRACLALPYLTLPCYTLYKVTSRDL